MTKSPNYRRLVECYRIARQAWREQGATQAAKLRGMDERSYCDAYLVRLGVLPYLPSATARALTAAEVQAAFEEAGR